MQRPEPPRIEGVSAEQFKRDYVQHSRPLIIEGAMKEWPALKHWSTDYLRDHCGTTTVEVEHYPNSNPVDCTHNIDMQLSDLLAKLEDDALHLQYYLAEGLLERVLPTLESDVDFSDLVAPGEKDRRTQVFIGRDSVSPLHYHARDEAILAQVVGNKRILLFSPQQSPNMYPHSWYKLALDNFSRVQLRHEDELPKRFPLYAAAEGMEVTLRPGEMLYIPVHWWHAVYGHAMSFSCTAFWRASKRRWAFPSPGFRVLSQAALHRAAHSLARGSARVLGSSEPIGTLLHTLGVIEDTESFIRAAEGRHE